MKNAILLLLCLSFLPIVYSTAQENDVKFEFGLKGGLNLTRYSDFNEVKFAPTLGGVVQYNLHDAFNLQAELVYSVQGTGKIYDPDYDQAFRFDYLNIPVLIKYEVFDRFYVECGPQLSILMRMQFVRYKSYGTQKQNYSSGFHTLDACVTGGCSYYFSSGIFTDIRYVHGLTDVDKYDSDVQSRHKVLQFTVGYLF